MSNFLGGVSLFMVVGFWPFCLILNIREKGSEAYLVNQMDVTSRGNSHIA